MYLANGARGPVLPELGASLGIAALDLTAAVATDQYGIMFAVPVLQIVSSIAIERRARRGRE